MIDYLIVGAGLYGAIFAHEAKAHGKNVLVVDTLRWSKEMCSTAGMYCYFQ